MVFYMRGVKTKSQIMILLCVLVGMPRAANADPLQPDRPGFSTGTYTLNPGETHIESGIQTDYGNNTGDPDSYTAPLINYRQGLTDATELNILWDGWSWLDGANKTFETNDLLLGLKQSIFISEQYNISWLGFVSLPSSQSDGVILFVGGLWDYSLTENILAFGTLQFVSSVNESGSRITNFQPAVGLSFSHTEKVSTFIEVYQDMPLQGDALNNSMMDAGIAYLLSDNIQLDFNFGVSLDQRSADFIGLGIAVRL